MPYGLTILVFGGAFVFNIYRENYVNAQFANGAYGYTLPHESYYFIVAMIVTLIMIGIAQWSSASLKHFLRSKLSLLGLTFYSTTLICIADILVSPWDLPQKCGYGFTRGNCFLADGLNEMIYFAIIPLCFIVGTGLFIANKRMKTHTPIKAA
jgi:hypothetical protein